MIKSISIHNYKSFHPSTKTEILIDTGTEKAVIFYGLNGTGKSALAEAIDGIGRKDGRFAHCSITTTNGGPYRYLVYNHHFVQRVIGEANGMPGIFSLGELDTDAQTKIDDAQVALKESNAEEAIVNGLIEEIERLASTHLETVKERAWDAHAKFGSIEPMKSWLQGYHKDKFKFYERLRAVAVGKEEKIDDIERLKQRWSDVSDIESNKELLSIDASGLSVVEKDNVWTQSIVGSSDSALAKLIQSLGNGDWVAEGQKFAHGEECPFCQQSLPSDFKIELSKFLSGDYEANLLHIRQIIQQYETQVEQLAASAKKIESEPFSKEEPAFKIEWESLHSRLSANLVEMRRKLEKPSESFTIVSTAASTGALKIALEKINARITLFNDRISNREAEKEKRKILFWKLMRNDRAEIFLTYESLDESIRERKEQYSSRQSKLREASKAFETQIAELKQRKTGVDAAVSKINRRLEQIGITSFSIANKPGENNFYCLARPGQSQSDPQSLSEGEKTLISFLYFIVLIGGSETATIDFPLEKTIAVVDDPISSLSHNYIFDVASLLQNEVIKPPQGQPRTRQVIVLTHNLFFLHELLKLGNKGGVLFRVLKDSHTSIEALNPNELLNDYDALWQILRDARDRKVSPQVVPNTMRCILEHFMWFTHRTDKFEKF